MSESSAQQLAPIALLVTVYNRQQRLERMLESVREEKELLDIIIVDDGSDVPVNVDRFSDYSIHLIRCEENRGTMAAANTGLEYILSKNYELIARLDSDDRAVNNRFTKQLQFMRDNPQIDIVGSLFLMVTPEGEEIRTSIRPYSHNDIYNYMYVDSSLHHPTMMLRSKVIRECGFYNTAYKAGGDYEYLMRILQKFTAANLREVLVLYETGGPDSLSSRRRRTQAINALKARFRHFNPLNIYSYAGLIYGLLAIANLLRYLEKLKLAILRFK